MNRLLGEPEGYTFSYRLPTPRWNLFPEESAIAISHWGMFEVVEDYLGTVCRMANLMMDTK